MFAEYKLVYELLLLQNHTNSSRSIQASNSEKGSEGVTWMRRVFLLLIITGSFHGNNSQSPSTPEPHSILCNLQSAIKLLTI